MLQISRDDEPDSDEYWSANSSGIVMLGTVAAKDFVRLMKEVDRENREEMRVNKVCEDLLVSATNYVEITLVWKRTNVKIWEQQKITYSAYGVTYGPWIEVDRQETDEYIHEKVRITYSTMMKIKKKYELEQKTKRENEKKREENRRIYLKERQEKMYMMNRLKMDKWVSKVDGKYKEGSWNKWKRFMGRCPSNHCDPSNREKYISEHLMSLALFELNDEDLKSVEEDEQVLNCPFFALVFNKVAQYNNGIKNSKRRIVLLHDQFLVNWLETKNKEIIQKNQCFPNSKSHHYIVPVLMNDHYVVVEMIKKGWNVFVDVYDSMFGKGGVQISKESLETLAVTIFGKRPRYGEVYVRFADDTDIFAQKDATSCGVLAIMNIEAILYRAKFNKHITRYRLLEKNHYLTQSINEERERLAKELRMIMEEESKVEKKIELVLPESADEREQRVEKLKAEQEERRLKKMATKLNDKREKKYVENRKNYEEWKLKADARYESKLKKWFMPNNHCVAENRAKYVPDHLMEMDLWSVDNQEIEIVAKDGRMGNKTFFVLLFNEIGNFNNGVNKEKRIVLLHYTFFEKWLSMKEKDELKEEVTNKLIRDNSSFGGKNSTHFIMPVVMNNHCLLVELKKMKKRVEVNVFDSLFGRRGIDLNIETCQLLAESIFGECVAKVAYATRNDIFEQSIEDATNDEIFVLINMEAILWRTVQGFKHEELFDFYTTDAIYDAREKLSVKLQVILDDESRYRVIMTNKTEA